MQVKNIDPRPPINQGIDINNPLVKEHTEIYNRLLAQVEEQHNTAIGLITMNPYGTAPLSGYCGLWSNVPSRVYVRITDDIGSITVGYYLELKIGANMIPLVGFSPGATNTLTVIPNIREMDEMEIDEVANSERSIVKTIVTDPLPPTDAAIPADPDAPWFTGFPIYEVTMPSSITPFSINELYFTAFCARYNVGVDYTGTVRWYTTLPSLAYNFERLANGHFISSDFLDQKTMYEFDIVGRVYKVFILDNNAHHSIYQLEDGNLMISSENTGTTAEDGVSIVDINTGLEIAYYDMRYILDATRRAVPRAPDDRDWLHINQSYFDRANNLIVTSGRHQCIFAIDASNAKLSFILGNHEDWNEELQKYLLTPVDETGAPLYDLSDPEDVKKADREFWSWGQHAVWEIPNESQGIVEFLAFDNGNFRSRNEAFALIPNDNHSRIVRYMVDLRNLTVKKLFEYGESEVGNRGYSAYVCNEQILDNGNYFVCFGGNVFDTNGRICTPRPGYTDIDDPLTGDTVEGRIILQEINPITKTPVVEFTCTSGRYKTQETDGGNYRVSFYSFRSFKWPIV